VKILTNLRYLKKSRIKPVPGDVFLMLIPSNKYIFGKVILAEPPPGQAPMPGTYLIYIYDWQSDDKHVNLTMLSPNRLLLPPIWTNRMGWTKGYFETVERLPLKKADLVSQHCFRRYNGTFLNEIGQELQNRVEPCGEWGLVSYRWIDDHVSDALGIPRVPEDENGPLQ
jgi:hypothetical protein